jgi:hypothetical protein
MGFFHQILHDKLGHGASADIAVANKKYLNQSVFLQSTAAKCRVLAVSALFSKSTFHIRKFGKTTEQRKSGHICPLKRSQIVVRFRLPDYCHFQGYR